MVGWVTKNGEEIPHEEALSIAVRDGHWERFPAAALDAMFDRRNDGIWLSPSAAGGYPRRKILESLHPYYVTPESMWAPLVGNGVHKMLSYYRGAMTENKLSTTVQVPLTSTGQMVNIEVKGTVDFYDPDTKRIIDYKTTKSFTYWDPVEQRRRHKTLPDDMHALQVNLYAFLLRQNGYDVDEALVWYIRREEASRKVAKVALMSDEDLYWEVVKLGTPLADFRDDGVLPPPFPDDHFLQRTSPVRHICEALQAEGK